SNYNTFKLLKLSLDGLISSSEQPLRLASIVGVVLAGLSFLAGLFMIYRQVIFGFVVTGYASLIVSIFFLSGLNLFFLGIIGEYLARIFRNDQGRPIFIVKETLNLDSPAIPEPVTSAQSRAIDYLNQK